MKIAITAASGNLSSPVVNQLKNKIETDNIIGLARTPENATHLGIEIREGDYDSPQELDVSLEGIDTVLLISGMSEPQKRIRQHRNVIGAAKSNSVKKIVYTSIVGNTEKTAFSSVVQSNRQTERDIQNSGLNWSIGRNGIYIEPDLEYINNYVKSGEIKNCAGNGKCTYTCRQELGYAYTKMLTHENIMTKYIIWLENLFHKRN